MRFPFGEPPIPRHWLHDSAIATHVVNGINLLFPKGERFFVRSVHHFVDRIDDEELRARVRAFAGQEGQHAHEHERFFQILRDQGFEIDEWLAFYDWLGYDVIERAFPPEVRLAVTAAAEHFTATFAEGALSDGFLEGAHPTVRALLLWHAAEEIEHKSVAFDVLEEVAPSYPLRLFGLLIATLTLGGFWISATRMLLAQEPDEVTAEERHAFFVSREIARASFRKAIVDYARPGFHPDQVKNHHLAADYLASLDAASA
jgi:predicted metal-dependent hydrolase